jgi:hypothetical protein
MIKHYHHAMKQDGMTLRDYFAAKVVQGLWANATALAQMPRGTETESIASVAYEMADAMLKERSK